MSIVSATSKSTSPEVVIIDHTPSFEDHLSDPVIERITLYADDPPECLYLNPIVTIACAAATNEFKAAVKKYRGRWCSQVKKVLSPGACRNVRSWPRRQPVMSHRDHYLDYAFSVVGVLFIGGHWTTNSKAMLSIQETRDTFLDPTWKRKTRQLLGSDETSSCRRDVSRHLIQLLQLLVKLVQHVDNVQYQAEQLDGRIESCGRPPHPANKLFTTHLRTVSAEAWEQTFTGVVNAAELMGYPMPEALWVCPPNEVLAPINEQLISTLGANLALHRTILNNIDRLNVPPDCPAATDTAMMKVKEQSRIKELEGTIGQLAGKRLRVNSEMSVTCAETASPPSADDPF